MLGLFVIAIVVIVFASAIEYDDEPDPTKKLEWSPKNACGRSFKFSLKFFALNLKNKLKNTD